MSAGAGTTATGDPPPPLIPSLPDDVALNCLARVPRLHHPILSAVSRPIRSLLASPLFFAARSLIGSAEPLLYLSLRSHQNPSNSWFALLRDHGAASELLPVLAPVPPVPGYASIGAAYAVCGPEIYVLGGSVNDRASPRVWVLDCRSHTWHAGPAMRVGREFAAAGVVAGKIYVLGGCAPDSWARAAHWAEVLDPADPAEGRAARWRAVPSPAEFRDKWMHASAVVGGRLFAMADRGGVAFDAAAGAWEAVAPELDLGWRGRACVIDGVLYCYDYLGKIRGFHVAGRGGAWRELRGVEKGLPKFLCGATMANVGGRLVVLWEEKGKGRGKEVEIWCAEIEVEVAGDGDLSGTVRWSSRLLLAPAGASIVHCMAVPL